MSERTVGHVISVEGSRLTGVLIDWNHGIESDGCGAGGIEFGALVKLRTVVGNVYGVVTGLWVENPSSPTAATRMLRIDLLGEIGHSNVDPCGQFRRGICRYPRLGDDILAVTDDDLAAIYAKPQSPSVVVGTVSQSGHLHSHVATDALLGKHFAVLGTTGTGKSCAVALILRAVLDRHPNGHVVILDPHNEYSSAFGERAEHLNPTNLRLPFWMMNFEELVSTFVVADGPEREAEINILKQSVLEARRSFAGGDGDPGAITVDTPVPFRLSDVQRSLNNGMGRLNRAESSLPYLRLLTRLDSLTKDARYAFLLEGLLIKDTMADVLAQLLRIPVDGRPVTILDLSGVPGEVVDAVVSLICRMVFDFAVWSVEPQAVPVLLVCEEAHRYVPEDLREGFQLSRRGVARIAREGRKYGLSLCLVSQRPSELSATILSQCNTIFALRLLNDRDQEFVRRVVPEGAGGLLAALPALHNREAIAVGEGVSIPMRLMFNDLPGHNRPRSSSASFADAWEYDAMDRQFVDDTIDCWRRQSREDADLWPLNAGDDGWV
ncbi:MAG: ATP-binding protein [Rhodospirillales bacterium]|nr:ATP-binding protein [Rhodospirillales bacterium]